MTACEVVPLDLQPGGTIQLDLNKSGAMVRGRLRLAGAPPAGLTFEFSLNSLVRREPDFASATAATPGVTREQLLSESRGDLSRSTAAHRAFTVKPTPEGEFRVGGVPAGDYWLMTRIYEDPRGGCLVDPVGMSVVPVTVTEAQAKNGESIDLPPVEVVTHRGPKVGEVLPMLNLRDADGKAIDLAKYKGRAVVFHGWAGWCAACPKDYAAIKKLHADFPANKLAMVGVNLDADAAECHRLSLKYGFSWPQAAVGTPEMESVVAKLAVSSVPLYIVLDAAGVVQHRGAVWADAEAAVRKLSP